MDRYSNPVFGLCSCVALCMAGVDEAGHQASAVLPLHLPRHLHLPHSKQVCRHKASLEIVILSTHQQ